MVACFIVSREIEGIQSQQKYDLALAVISERYGLAVLEGLESRDLLEPAPSKTDRRSRALS